MAEQRPAPARVPLSNPDKVLFPDDGITKAELAEHYARVAELMVPHCKDRPMNLWRWNKGIAHDPLIQQSLPKGAPDWVARCEVPRRKGGDITHGMINDADTLRWLAQQNCITPHVWNRRAPNLYHPDICVFDLDPGRDEPDVLRAAALALRDLLDELGLPSWVKTSGSKGFHIAVPLDGKAHVGDVARFAHVVGTLLVKRDPKHLTQEFSKADRGGRILVDTGRNNYSATFAAAYAVRPKPGAPVSAPCTWDEIEGGKVGPQTFTLHTMAKRIESVGDLWGDMRKRGRSLKRAAEKLRRLNS